MMISKRHIPRRLLLRGVGTTLALPWLNAMAPATARAAAPVRRLSVVYAPMGVNVAKWTPPAEGPLVLSPILAPLEPFRDQLLVLSGLDSRVGVQGAGNHSRAGASWLTGASPRPTEGAGFEAGTSMDQIVANASADRTQLASLELGLESSEIVGACEPSYACAYTATISWRTPTTPLPMEADPRAVFERLFGDSGTTDSRIRQDLIQKNRSMLDSVMEQMARLRRGVGPTDRAKLDQYFDAVRDVERRIQKAEEQAAIQLPVVQAPVSAPVSYEAYARLMIDLLVLAYQCDLTRVSTFMLGRELSVRTFPEIGVADAHHPLSHHQDNPVQLEKQAKVNAYHVRLYAYLLERLRTTQDAEGSLLDHTLSLYGSGMSNSNVHLIKNLPTLIVGGSTVGFRGGRHIRYPDATPVSNLQMSLIHRMGVDAATFGDATGTLDLS